MNRQTLVLKETLKAVASAALFAFLPGAVETILPGGATEGWWPKPGTSLWWPITAWAVVGLNICVVLYWLYRYRNEVQASRTWSTWYEFIDDDGEAWRIAVAADKAPERVAAANHRDSPRPRSHVDLIVDPAARLAATSEGSRISVLDIRQSVRSEFRLPASAFGDAPVRLLSLWTGDGSRSLVFSAGWTYMTTLDDQRDVHDWTILDYGMAKSAAALGGTVLFAGRDGALRISGEQSSTQKKTFEKVVRFTHEHIGFVHDIDLGVVGRTYVLAVAGDRETNQDPNERRGPRDVVLVVAQIAANTLDLREEPRVHHVDRARLDAQVNVVRHQALTPSKPPEVIVSLGKQTTRRQLSLSEHA